MFENATVKQLHTYLSVRSCDSNSAKEIGKIFGGERVQWLRDGNNGYCYVRYHVKDGSKEGWVHAQYLVKDHAQSAPPKAKGKKPASSVSSGNISSSEGSSNESEGNAGETINTIANNASPTMDVAAGGYNATAKLMQDLESKEYLIKDAELFEKVSHGLLEIGLCALLAVDLCLDIQNHVSLQRTLVDIGVDAVYCGAAFVVTTLIGSFVGGICDALGGELIGAGVGAVIGCVLDRLVNEVKWDGTESGLDWVKSTVYNSIF